MLNERYGTYKEFEEERSKTDERLEFIDGVIYMSHPPVSNIKKYPLIS